MPRSSLSTTTHAVVAVYRDRVLWIESPARGGIVWASAPLESEALASVVSAALAARTAANGSARDVVLALGPAWVALRFLALPELGAKERRVVLERKACAVLGKGRREALFAARAHSVVPAVQGDAQKQNNERWLVVAAERERLEALRDEFARARMRVRRIVAARLATLATAAPDCVALVAQRDPDGVALSLLARAALLQQGALAHASSTALSTALFQEAQSHAAFARRTLRGETASELVLLGFQEDEGGAFEAQLGGGLGLARTRRSDGEDALAHALLEGALASGTWTLDLLSEPRPRPRRAAFLSAAALLLAVSLAALTSRELDRQRSELGSELRELQRQMGAEERASGSESGLPARIAKLERAVERVEVERALGRSFGDELEFVGAAVGGDARIEAFETTADGLRLEGSADPRPLVALAAIERIRRRLSNRFSVIEVAPRGTNAPGAESRERFVLSARRSP